MVEIAAILISPILAFVVGKWITDRKEQRQRRHQVFQSLWLTRGDLGTYGRLSPEHVRALNMIEIEFANSDDLYPNEALAAVLMAWTNYRQFLNTPATDNPEKPWDEARDGLLVDLLFEMSRALGYKFQREQIRTGAYAPQGYLNNDLESMVIRSSLRALVQGERPLHIAMVAPVEPRAVEAPPQSLTIEQPGLAREPQPAEARK